MKLRFVLLLLVEKLMFVVIADEIAVFHFVVVYDEINVCLFVVCGEVNVC